jgi:membrane protease subunit HflK
MPWDEKGSDGKNHGPWGKAPDANYGKEKRPGAPQSQDIENLIRKVQEAIENIFNGKKDNGGGKPSGEAPWNSLLMSAIALIAVCAWLLSGVYTVNTKEAGVVTRFGKYVRTATSGLNYHLPAPLEDVIKISVTDRYRTEIGAHSDKIRPSRSKAENKSSEDLLMLTGDENLVDVNFEVQWQIENAEKFLFNVYDPQLTVRNAAESAMREMIGTTPLGEILSEGRSELQQKTKELLQGILDSYDAGIHIETINMRGVPPTSQIKVDNIIAGEDGEMKSERIDTTVDAAFKDVQAAIINKEEIINMAIARSNEVIPEARGQAQKLIQDAQGYKEQAVAKAQGEANRFNAVYREYAKAKDVTKKRMYLETMEQIVDGMDKIIMDGKSGGLMPYMPIKELGSK